MEKLMDYLKNDNGELNIYLATATAALLAVIVWKFSSRSAQTSSKKSSKKKKNVKRAEPVQMTLEKKIENVHLRYKNEYEERIKKVLGTFNPDSEKDVYEKNYCNEMLLKLLIELDGIDLVNEEPERKKQLKEQRKLVIKEIQGQLKKLDTLA
ncbi:HSP70 co-chaperone SNL1 [Nakaseomyces bracarensis]|uniref:HSP70 co-chaperone SNL1 n=1 Tax=Nakaseomyces bracarensis TaxID=273131 RepID=A0ABR4NW66_9SACH